MSQGRPRHEDPPIRKNVHIPSSVVVAVELHLFDPLRGKSKYGGWSDLMTELLRNWLEEQKADAEKSS